MSDNRWSANRRTFVKTAGAAGVVGLAGCSDGGTSGDSGNSATEEVTWVMNPAEEEIDIRSSTSRCSSTESEADIEIIEQPTASYSGTAQELRRASEGDRVFADTSPGAVAQIPDQLDVTGMRVAYGAEKYFSLITTTADSDIEELADLEGEVFASAAPTSVSGTLFPLYMLSNGDRHRERTFRLARGLRAPDFRPLDRPRTAHSGRPDRGRRDRRFLHGVTRPAGAVRRDVTGVRRHLGRVRRRRRRRPRTPATRRLRPDPTCADREQRRVGGVAQRRHPTADDRRASGGVRARLAG